MLARAIAGSRASDAAARRACPRSGCASSAWSCTTFCGHVRADFDIPILLVTHSLEECFELADEMFVFRDGPHRSERPSGGCMRDARVARHRAAARDVQHPAGGDPGARSFAEYECAPASANTTCKATITQAI